MTDKQRLEIVEKLAGVGSYDLKKKKNRNNICDKLSFTKETDKVCYRLFMVVSPKKLNGISYSLSRIVIVFNCRLSNVSQGVYDI